MPLTRNIGFGLFDRGIQFFESLSNGGGLSAEFDAVRAEPMHEFVREDVCEERIEIYLGLLRAFERDFGNGDERLIEFRFLRVFQHHAFGAFFFHNAFIVRQIEGRGLHIV